MITAPVPIPINCKVVSVFPETGRLFALVFALRVVREVAELVTAATGVGVGVADGGPQWSSLMFVLTRQRNP